MIKQLISVSAALVVASALVAATPAQAPDFTGTWVLDSSRRAAPDGSSRAGGGGGGTSTMSGGGGGTMRGGGGQPFEIRVTQTAAELVVERLAPTSMKWIYKLDGTESVNTNGRTTTRTTSRWNGRSLVTEGTHIVVLDDNEMRGTVREVRSLNADGQLVIVTTRTAEGQTTEAPVVTQTFRKK